jgi:hypothetical protein
VPAEAGGRRRSVSDEIGLVEGSRRTAYSLARPEDAPWRNTGKFFGAMEFDGECVSIRAGWAAHDAPEELVASMARGIGPGPVIGHRAFDAKASLIVIGDDEEERPWLFGHCDGS